MQITLLRSPGNQVLKDLELSSRRAEMMEGNIVDVPDEAGQSLIDKKIAVAGAVEQQPVRAVPGGPAIKAAPGRSPEVGADRNVEEFNESPAVGRVEPGKPKKAQS